LWEREEAEPVLRRAQRSPDAEVRRRTARILKSIESYRADRTIHLAIDMAAQARVDQLVELLVCWRDLDRVGTRWQIAGKLARRLVASNHCLYPGYYRSASRNDNPWEDHTSFRTSYRHIELCGSRLDTKEKEPAAYLLCAERIVLRSGALYSLVIASRSIKAPLLMFVVVLANGPVEIGPFTPPGSPTPPDTPVLSYAVLVVDGNVHIRGPSHTCFIMASGKIICDDYPGGSTLVSASSIEVPRQTRKGQLASRIVSNDPTLLGLVRFFTLRQAGIEVRPSRRGLTITALDPRKPLGCTRCRPGDEILTVNGRKVRQAEELRVLLRQLAARRLPAELTLRRGDKVFSQRCYVD
jgi:hypothetical protein